MKQLTDAERLEIAVSLLSEDDVDVYARLCSEKECDCERNGFHDVPAECENRECSECEFGYDARHGIDCPYTE